MHYPLEMYIQDIPTINGSFQLFFFIKKIRKNTICNRIFLAQNNLCLTQIFFFEWLSNYTLSCLLKCNYFDFKPHFYGLCFW